MRLITLKRIQQLKAEEAAERIYIDGNTVITKRACHFATENGIALILVKTPVINEAHMEATIHPEQKIAKIISKARR